MWKWGNGSLDQGREGTMSLIPKKMGTRGSKGRERKGTQGLVEQKKGREESERASDGKGLKADGQYFVLGKPRKEIGISEAEVNKG